MIWNGYGSWKRTLCTFKDFKFCRLFCSKTRNVDSDRTVLEECLATHTWISKMVANCLKYRVCLASKLHQGSPLASNKWIPIETFLYVLYILDLLNLRAEMCEHNCEWMLTGPADMSQNPCLHWAAVTPTIDPNCRWSDVTPRGCFAVVLNVNTWTQATYELIASNKNQEPPQLDCKTSLDFQAVRTEEQNK